MGKERQKHLDNERKIHESLSSLWHEGQLDGVLRVSGAVSRYQRWKILRGVDFLVIQGNEGFAIESKSSENGAREHRRRGRRTPVVIPGTSGASDLTEEIRTLLEENQSGWSTANYSLFYDLLEFSYQRPDLWSSYAPLVRLMK